MEKYQTALVIGGGAFGTSIACVLASKFQQVLILVRSKDVFDSLSKGENSLYLNGMVIPKNISPVMNWDEVANHTKSKIDLIVSGLPSHAISEFHKNSQASVAEYLDQNIPYVCLAKGIDADSLFLPDDLYNEIFPDYADQFCYLSGPSFAREIIEKQVTCVSLAGKSREMLLKATNMLTTSYLKIFPTYDIKGVLLGGALKNVLAIAGGIVEGLGFNHNTRAAMITRGIEEMLRFGKVFNAREETFYGYSGMGDLILTTTGDLSRNKNFGVQIAKGKKPREIIDSQRTVVEGYKTTLAAYRLAQKFDLSVRLFDGVYYILYENLAPQKVLDELMKAPVKFGDKYLSI